MFYYYYYYYYYRMPPRTTLTADKTLIPVLYATSSEVLVMCNFLNLKLIQKYSTLVQKMANILLKINYRNLPVN